LKYSLVGSLTLDLLLAIHSNVAKEIPDIVQWTRVNVSEELTEYSLSYAVSEEHDAFCVLCISVSQFEPPKLFFEVDVDYESHCMEDGDDHRINNGRMSKYAYLWPVITNGFIDYFGVDENGKTNLDKPAAKPRFKVKYHVTRAGIDEIEGYRDSYGFDEIANRIIPYIKSLHETFKMIHPNNENLNGSMV